MKTGSNGSELATLQATFADTDYVLWHYEDCRFSSMRWQCGRNVADIVTLADGSGYIVERFELLAWSESIEDLIDTLS